MNILGTEVNTSNLTLEELQELRKKTIEILTHIEYQIQVLQKIKHRHHSSE